MDSLVHDNGGSDSCETGIEFSSANLSGESLIGASCPDSSLSLVDVSRSSSQNCITEFSHKAAKNMNHDDAFLLHQNVNQEVMTQYADGVLESSDEMFHVDRNSNDNLPEKIGRKPGIILLGRGNSFSLGRSEVILLHTNRQNRRISRRNNSKYLSSIEDSDNIQNNNNIFKTQNNRNQNKPILAPVSNTTSQVVTNLTQEAQDKCVPGELETLWQKAEVIMIAKETVVQQVLEEFGIAEVGSQGGEGEEKMMEETIWQAVQDNFHI